MSLVISGGGGGVVGIILTAGHTNIATEIYKRQCGLSLQRYELQTLCVSQLQQHSESDSRHVYNNNIRTLRCTLYSPISHERFTRYNCRLKFIAFIYVWVCVKCTVNGEGWKRAQMNREIKEFFRHSTSPTSGV
ncbi:hypothetical protein QTP88_010174 [Uroleucon formosanum]